MNSVILVGLILIFALIGGHIAQLLRFPEVVGYFAVGLLMGPSFSRILSQDAVATLEFFGEIALGLILFSIGSIFDFENLKRVGRSTLNLTMYIFGGTSVIVFLVMMVFNGQWQISLLLAAIAVEVSPIATILVMREANAQGPLTNSVYNVVALNNLVCLIVFGAATFVVRLFSGSDSDSSLFVTLAQESLIFLWSNIGALALGIALGYMLAFWGRQVDENGELLMLVLGTLLVVVGTAHWLGVSSLIASMTLGATLINLAPRARRLFDVLGQTDPPLYAIFFVLAGAHLQLSSLWLIGLSGIGYTLARILGKVAGAWYGAGRLGYPAVVQKYLGITLIAHAGVAIGLALQIRDSFPLYSEVIAAVILGSVLINEVLGPVLTKFAVFRAGEGRRERAGEFEAV